MNTPLTSVRRAHLMCVNGPLATQFVLVYRHPPYDFSFPVRGGRYEVHDFPCVGQRFLFTPAPKAKDAR